MWEEGGYGYPRMGRFRLEEVRDPNGIAPNWNKMGAIDHVTTHLYGQRRASEAILRDGSER